MIDRLKRFIREPMLHFLLLGGVLFGANAWHAKSAPDEDRPNRIEVTTAVIDRLRAGYERQFGTPPDADELQGLVDAHIREEVLFREALAMGLDRDDTIVRRRLAQKMEFLTSDLATTGATDEKELERYFVANSKRYARPANLDFRHVYFSNAKHGLGASTEAKKALEALRQGADDTALGDAFLHGFNFDNLDPGQISSLFGPGFASDLADLPEGGWHGPVASSYGIHLVTVTSRTQAAAVLLSEVHPEVVRDFEDEHRRETNRRFYDALRARYDISVDTAALQGAAAHLQRTAQE